MLETAIEHMFFIADDDELIVIYTSFMKYPIQVHKSKLKYSFFGECLRMNVWNGSKRKDKKYMIPLKNIEAVILTDIRRRR